MSSCAYNYYIQAHSIRIGQFIAKPYFSDVSGIFKKWWLVSFFNL